jgi:hypothetical protein
VDIDEEIARKPGAVILGNRFMRFIKESKWKHYDGSGVEDSTWANCSEKTSRQN